MLIQTYHMHPSAQLSLQEEDLQDSERMPSSWFDSRSNAVYATLPKESDMNHTRTRSKHHRSLRHFHSHRHLSRYERQYRLENNIDLQPEWDGIYSFATEAINTTANTTTAQRDLRAVEDVYQVAPLSQGYGTHYAHVWVGSPVPQRKSVIVDTGSHFTAFPCTGCAQCGEQYHTDPYYDFSQSVTFRALTCRECQLGAQCRHDQCTFSQSYTEGSSWDAFQVQDMFYLAGNNVLHAADPDNQKHAIPFLFGCQTAEKGLFVTQLADGIMGMSAHEFTLPKRMYDAGKLQANMFSMCFRRALATSRRGVTAGFMTLGGIDDRIDSSPIIYANNVASSGWFTVHVKNIFLRTNGGQSATSLLENDQHIIKIPLDPSVVNSGKGVIVDSGTTDTYLHKNLAKSFTEVWKQVTGKKYSHAGFVLTNDQLRRLPTILVQCRAFNEQATEGYPRGTIGLARDLDPSSPNDVLIAIPATNYMEYSPATNQYTSRLYFTETRGGVLGANAMQGHNVIFDWGNGRIGFAESSCEYKDEHEPPKDVKESATLKKDCVLGKPSLSRSCVESVDLGLCQQNPNMVLKGAEMWTMTVENTSSGTGRSCEAVALAIAMNSSAITLSPSTIDCDGAGICSEFRPCELSCADAPAVVQKEHAMISNTANTLSDVCDSGWSSCGYSCMQTKVTSEHRVDGTCHELSRKNRQCHVGACGASDPCLVPYHVRVVLGLGGTDHSLLTKQSQELLSTAIVGATHRLSADAFAPFDIGDVEVKMTSSWFPEDGAENDVNTRVDLQISVFNGNANSKGKETGGAVKPVNRFLQFFSGLWSSSDQVAKLIHQPRCDSSDMYRLAKHTVYIHSIMEKPEFLSVLVDELELAKSQYNSKAQSPFQALYTRGEFLSKSRMLFLWTEETEDKNRNDGFSFESMFAHHTKRLRKYANERPVISVVAGTAIMFVIISAFIGAYEREVIRKFFSSRIDSYNITIKGSGANDDDDEDSEILELLPTRALSSVDDAASVSSRSSIDRLFDQLVTDTVFDQHADDGSPVVRKYNSPTRRRPSPESASAAPKGDLEMATSPSNRRIAFGASHKRSWE